MNRREVKVLDLAARADLQHPDGTCPVCGMDDPGNLSGRWGGWPVHQDCAEWIGTPCQAELTVESMAAQALFRMLAAVSRMELCGCVGGDQERS